MIDIKGKQARAVQLAVVDDDPSVRQALHRLLHSAGFAVETFADADAFLHSKFELQQCLILDLQMPQSSGLDLQKALADLNLKKPIPIIFITAHPDQEFKRRALENGAVGFLEKPFDDLALIQLIDLAVANPAA